MLLMWFFIFTTIFALIIFSLITGHDTAEFLEAVMRGALCTVLMLVFLGISLLMAFGMVHVFHSH